MNPTNIVEESSYGIDCPYIDMQWGKGTLFISNPVLRLLQNPRGIKIRWNCDKNILTIEGVAIDDPDGYPVIGKHYQDYGSVYMGCLTLISAIWSKTEWSKELKYRMVARYNVPSNIAIFDFYDAEALEIVRNARGRRVVKHKVSKSDSLVRTK